METINQTLFLFFNAPANAAASVLGIARILAEDLIWIVPAGLLIGWLRGGDAIRRALLQATCASILALTFAQLIGRVWPHPRPFMIGLGHLYLAHVPDASFPSDHLTLWWSVSFSLLACRKLRKAGVALSLFGLPMAWARVYLGVHFPLDMAGSAGVALLSGVVSMRFRDRYMTPLFSLATATHRTLFAPLIQRGWLRG